MVNPITRLWSAFLPILLHAHAGTTSHPMCVPPQPPVLAANMSHISSISEGKAHAHGATALSFLGAPEVTPESTGLLHPRRDTSLAHLD